MLLKVQDADEMKWLELSADFFNFLNQNQELISIVVEANFNSKWEQILEKLNTFSSENFPTKRIGINYSYTTGGILSLSYSQSVKPSVEVIKEAFF